MPNALSSYDTFPSPGFERCPLPALNHSNKISYNFSLSPTIFIWLLFQPWWHYRKNLKCIPVKTYFSLSVGGILNFHLLTGIFDMDTGCYTRENHHIYKNHKFSLQNLSNFTFRLDIARHSQVLDKQVHWSHPNDVVIHLLTKKETQIYQSSIEFSFTSMFA